jgi:hypothetical protein
MEARQGRYTGTPVARRAARQPGPAQRGDAQEAGLDSYQRFPPGQSEVFLLSHRRGLDGTPVQPACYGDLYGDRN